MPGFVAASCASCERGGEAVRARSASVRSERRIGIESETLLFRPTAIRRPRPPPRAAAEDSNCLELRLDEERHDDAEQRGAFDERGEHDRVAADLAGRFRLARDAFRRLAAD